MKAFVADDSGATAIEYCMIAGVVSIVIVGAVTVVGTTVKTLLNGVLAGLH